MKLRATVLLSFVVCACASPAAPQGSLQRDERSPDASNGWTRAYSSGTRLESNGANQPVVAIPTDGTLNMLTKVWTGSTAGRMLRVTVQVGTTGTPEILLAQGPEPTCRTPPSTRPYLEANGGRPCHRLTRTCAGGAGRGWFHSARPEHSRSLCRSHQIAGLA
jgi:hypothetical protein